MRAPIIVTEDGELEFFRSAARLAQHCEPIGVQEGPILAFDSEGRRLRVFTREYDRPVLFGTFKVRDERVEVEAEEEEPTHADELRRVLVEFLGGRGLLPVESAEGTPLQALLERAIAAQGYRW